MAQFCNFSRNIVCCYGKVRFLYCTREYPDCDAATASAGFLNGVTSLHVNDNHYHQSKRLVRTVLIFTESSDQLSRATDRVPDLPASPGYVQ
ncbi:hypothetical protein HH184_003517 [Escherichia coli]|nr:hypothetical protein [Escherichia coli]